MLVLYRSAHMHAVVNTICILEYLQFGLGNRSRTFTTDYAWAETIGGALSSHMCCGTVSVLLSVAPNVWRPVNGTICVVFASADSVARGRVGGTVDPAVGVLVHQLTVSGSRRFGSC